MRPSNGARHPVYLTTQAGVTAQALIEMPAEVQIRVRLVNQRRQNVPFGLAWRLCWANIRWPHEDDERAAAKAGLGHPAVIAAFRAAYDGADSRALAAMGVLAIETVEAPIPQPRGRRVGPQNGAGEAQSPIGE